MTNEEAVRLGIIRITDLPISEQTEEIKKIVLQMDPMEINHIPNPTKEDVGYAIMQYIMQSRVSNINSLSTKEAFNEYLTLGEDLLKKTNEELFEIYDVKGLLKRAIYLKEIIYNADVIKGYPAEIKDADFFEKAVELNPLAYLYCPYKYRSQKLAEVAIAQDPKLIPFLIKDGISITSNLLKKEICGPNFFSLDSCVKYLSDELLELAVIYRKIQIQSIPEDRLTKKLCSLAVKRASANYMDIPSQFKTKTMLLYLASDNLSSIVDYLEPEMLTTAYLNYVMKVKKAHRDDKWEEHNLWFLDIEKISEDQLTQELCNFFAEESMLGLKRFPEQYRTPELKKIIGDKEKGREPF